MYLAKLEGKSHFTSTKALELLYLLQKIQVRIYKEIRLTSILTNAISLPTI